MSQSTSPLNHQQAQTWLHSQQPLWVDQQSALSEHLASCAHCQAYAQVILRLETDLPGAIPGRELSEADVQREVRALQAQRNSQSSRVRLSGLFRTAAFVGLFAGLLVFIYYVGGQLDLPFKRSSIPGQPGHTGETVLLASEQATATPLQPTPPPYTQDMASTGLPTLDPSPTFAPPPRVIVWPDAGEVNLRSGPGTTYETAVSTLAINGKAVTFLGAASTQYPQNMIYHKDAISFATADLLLPQGVDMASRQVHNGISLRVVRQYDINNDRLPCRIDVLYGYNAIRPPMAVRLWG